MTEREKFYERLKMRALLGGLAVLGVFIGACLSGRIGSGFVYFTGSLFAVLLATVAVDFIGLKNKERKARS